MKEYTKPHVSSEKHSRTGQVFECFDAPEIDYPHTDGKKDERARKIARLKAMINAGEYEPDIMDIAKLLTSAMDPTL
ncbi:flagellar biosynthesis anti-sigma factor FlgM [Pseudodesulfovibrio sp. JC047]|uniref:flagellar biosynthesis anti-sigma factor FlgM n=1 Tax=Pseudodesulfovibrio sp. JC047 TaxID=2683199 RepID=UPI0013D46253|nr:flagellar biosynthesis anti-sigma factor FlgM [Pseudodesulfovibrio sp. JC047]NDV18091.1 flagellar biosynthesis anti-sigma factor FlgM [Pseudodesulfovibrio sp. JC047]